MKKFLAVFDGYKMSESTMEYAIQLTKLTGAHLVGVFLNEFIYHSYSAYQVMTTYKNYEEVLKQLDAKDTEKREEDETYTRQEYSYSSFERSFSLPDEVNKDKIDAHYKDGVLELVLPKKEEAKKMAVSKQIEVK